LRSLRSRTLATGREALTSSSTPVVLNPRAPAIQQGGRRGCRRERCRSRGLGRRAGRAGAAPCPAVPLLREDDRGWHARSAWAAAFMLPSRREREKLYGTAACSTSPRNTGWWRWSRLGGRRRTSGREGPERSGWIPSSRGWR